VTTRKRPRIRNPEAVADARKLVGAGADIELVLLFFRDRGFDIADCIFALEELFPKQSHEARSLVTGSQAWAHRYESSSQLREAVRER
jgi:hypothetical protein